MNTSKWIISIATFLTSFAIDINAQPKLSGSLTNTQGDPLPYATVLLLAATDSALAKGAITDETGRYDIANFEPGVYRISASTVGYETAWTEKFTMQKGMAVEMPTIVLKEGIALDEVVVRGKMPMYELKQDRMVMNVGASPVLSGNTGIEILQKTPGVIVDRQNNSIGLNAKGEVLMMINNKIQRVPKQVLMAQLQGMRAENIDRIEIIHQPPAKYDASGAAGIIHIVLKKNALQGTNGSLSLYGGYGQREKAGLNLNLNSRKRKFNWYGDYNYNRSRSNNYEVNHFREYDYQGDHYYHENFATLHNNREGQHAANLGVDVDFEGRTVIGFLVGGALSESVWGSNADSRSFDFVNDEMTGENRYLFGSKTDMSSLSANANVFQKIGSDGHLNVNLDYAKIRYGNSGDLENNEDPDHAITYDRSTPMEFYITSLDYVNQLGAAWTVETGVKGTFNKTINTTSVYDEYGTESGLFPGEEKIREQILAAYLSFNGELSEKLNAELGIRYERYTYRLDREDQEDFNKIFENPFPVLRLNYKIDSLNTVQLGFNRSITRPSFFHLTSFLVLFDPSLIVFSNPRLRPTFTNNFKISWQRNSAILSLGYLRRKDLINWYNTVDKENHLQISTPINFDRESIIEANLSFPVSTAPWWQMNWNFGGLYHKVHDASSRPAVFKKDIFTYSVQFNSSFLLANEWTASIDGRYMSPYLGGDQIKYNYPYLNIGVRKKFPSGSSLSIAVQDITNSSGKREWEYHQPELGIRTFGVNDFSERQVRVTYTYLFGNQKLSGKRKRNTGLEEIKNRM
jgi:hypothetical protein